MLLLHNLEAVCHLCVCVNIVGALLISLHARVAFTVLHHICLLTLCEVCPSFMKCHSLTTDSTIGRHELKAWSLL